MRNYTTYKIIGLLLIFIGSSLMMNSKEPLRPYFVIDKNPDYCGKSTDKEFTIALNIGEMTKSDSLYGYSFQISYDTTKIELNQFLYYNTLSEGCEKKDGSSWKAESVFRGAAANIFNNTMLTGNKPLFAISGKILSSCIDSTIIKLDYIEFTDEFTKDSIVLPEYKINIEKIDNDSRYLNVYFVQDTLKSNEDSLVIVSVDLNNNISLNNPVCFIKGNIDLIKKETISSANSNVKIASINENDGVLCISITGNNIFTGDLLTFETQNKFKADDSLQISIATDYCSCFTRISGDVVNYKYVEVQDTTTKSVKDKDAYFVNYQNEKLILKENEIVKEIVIYNIYGAIKNRISVQYQKDIEVNFENLENGVYGVSIIYDKPYTGQTEKRILVIKN